jgi:outer membrane protein assembly factor BamD (BamD/ComL family)
MPSAPPLGPPDWLRALAVGLLNLSGLGLGYALLRRWFALVVCLTATGILLVIALPADPDGVPGGAVVAYAVFLVLAALHGAARGLRRPLLWPPRSPLALVLGLVLLAAPAGGVVFYDSARDEATQQMLLDRLAAADRLVATAKTMSFDEGESDYRAALTAYRDLNDNHAGSRAAERVPDRLKAYYTAIAAPYDTQQYCEAITPLRYLRTVPDNFDDKALGSLVTWPDDRLATSFYECGADELATDASAAKGDYLAELLSAFPRSAQAKKVEPLIRSAIDSAAKALKGSDPCGATDRLGALGIRADSLGGSAAGVADSLASDTSRADSYVESGTYTCGLHEYKSGDFEDALSTMNDFITTYPNNKNRPLAGKIAIAAEVAEEIPAAGKKVPTTDSGGSITVTVLNDSPDEVEVLYTGPVTGKFTLAACGSCSSYSSDSSATLSACSSSTNYPQKTLSLPAGTTYFLRKSASGSGDTPGTHTAKLEYGYIYTECAYVVDSLYGY